MKETETLEQSLFEAVVAVCDRFPSLNPFSVSLIPIRDFCDMLNRIKISAKKSRKKKSGKILVPARDTWF